MKPLFSLLSAVCLLHLAIAQCDLSKRAADKDFPNIEHESVLSYQMGVEFTIPGASQTDYFMEYYDTLNRRGRVESHIEGENRIYIYRTSTAEAWEIKGETCTLKNVTDTPQYAKSDVTEWLYLPSNDEKRRTVGPSAMFKTAYDTWNSASRKIRMAYMGNFSKDIRGMKAQYWRRCISDKAYVDYYFSVKEVENPFNLEVLKYIPLRVVFGGERSGEMKELNDQIYEIMTFQPVISEGLEPFQLPQGLNCRRGPSVDPPELPSFASNNLLFSAEVVYKKIQISQQNEISSYYSNLMLALDHESDHIAYFYSPWNTTKSEEGKKIESFVDTVEYKIYDMKYEYLYKIQYSTGRCDVTRTNNFDAKYKLPEGDGSLSLFNPYVLFPNNELTYLTNSSTRGVAVDVFEAYIENFQLDDETEIKKVIVTHSYLKENEVLDNTAMVKKAPVQITLRMFRKNDIEEILTFNFFGFTTRLVGRSRIFDVTRCYPNDDDYLWLTMGFETDKAAELDMLTLSRDLWGIRRAMMEYVILDTALTPIRVPLILVTPRVNAIYITLLILGKPTLYLDFLQPEDGKVIENAQMDGLSDFDTCASKCLERGECWGISMCDAVCYYGSPKAQTIKPRKGCTLYRRYKNETVTMPSKEVSVKELQMQVEQNKLKLRVPTSDTEITMIATSSFVSDAAEDDSYFQRMGRELNPRMRIVKVGKKLKNAEVVKNLGHLHFDQCQRLCLDYKDCETVSYCLKNSVCAISSKYGEEIKDEEMEEDFQCNIVTRKYADHFTRAPGIVLSISAAAIKGNDIKTVEQCAKACMKETAFKCLSFDHCAQTEESPCRLHTVHYTNSKTREAVQKKSSLCGHYTKKYSVDFKKSPGKRMLDPKVPAINQVSLEDCAKACVEYGGGVCYGFDFCQDKRMVSTSCIVLNQEPSLLRSAYSPVCSNYMRTEQQFEPRPYTTGYAAGIGILCFLIGGVFGVAILFAIAYLKANK